MINHLHGKLVEKNPAFIIIECAGVGYFVNISLTTYAAIPDKEECRIYTHLQINEDAHTLFGFADEEERKLFRSLISVSGVGASTARMILSSMNPTEILSCIVNGDVARLKSVKGIGEKTAQRMILELKDKLQDFAEAAPKASVEVDVLSALENLGYNRALAESAIRRAVDGERDPAFDVLFKRSLQILTKG